MYELIFYRNKRGQSAVVDYIMELSQKSFTDKESRINYQKIVAYFNMLELHGTRLDKKYVKHLVGPLWELRPIKTRILFAYYKDNKFVILHYFIKKTNKTPKGEIELASKHYKDFLEREDEQ